MKERRAAGFGLPPGGFAVSISPTVTATEGSTSVVCVAAGQGNSGRAMREEKIEQNTKISPPATDQALKERRKELFKLMKQT